MTGVVLLAAGVLVAILLAVRIRRRLSGDAALRASNEALERHVSAEGWLADVVISLLIWAAVVGLGWIVWATLVRSLML